MQLDKPELCPFGQTQCPAGTYSDTVNIAILAADENGLVADGRYQPTGIGYVRAGYDLTWALCLFGFRGVGVENPDCTQETSQLLPARESSWTLSTQAAQQFLQTAFQPDKPFQFKQLIGMAVERAADQQREWGVKSITLSNRAQEEINMNPILEEVTVEGVPVQSGPNAFREVETGNVYKIEWKVPEDKWQEYRVKTADGEIWKQERYILGFWSNVGSFSREDPINVWQKDENTSELTWTPPQEVPAEGMEVTLFFNLMDQRGGSSWTWGKVKVKPGSAPLSP